MRRGLRLLNVTKSTVVATNLCLAEGPWERACGLLGRAALAPGEGLVIPRCRSVHMWGMRFAIDVLFVNEADQVVWQRQGLRPWQLSPVIWTAAHAIELPVGALAESRTCVGDQLTLSKWSG